MSSSGLPESPGPETESPVAEDKKALYDASQWQLIWWRFRRHRAAIVSIVVLALIYTSGIFCEFFAPYDAETYNDQFSYAPPQRIRFRTPEGFSLRPVVFGFDMTRDPETLRRMYEPSPEKVYPIRFFIRGDEYKLLGLFPTSLRLFGVEEGTVFLLGTDRMGRDILSRVLYGTRVSTTIGLVGVFISLILGISIGGVAGFFGGALDTIVQRVIEYLRSIPTLPLWMGLSAAIPPHLPVTARYFMITVILSVIGWTGLARVVRSKFLSLREEDYVMAAKIVGAKEGRIIFRHMLPSFMSHIIASMTLAVPGMILGETSLSFLGLGMRPPAISWGILLQEAQNIRSVSLYPWVLIPGLAVVVTVLAFNFLGDGLRDAADPYSN
jgi:peptide/nickel transport system permease protein